MSSRTDRAGATGDPGRLAGRLAPRSSSEEPIVDIYGHSVAPTARQAPKLAALRRTHPGLLVLGQGDDGTLELSVPARVLHGHVQPPRACLLGRSGARDWEVGGFGAARGRRASGDRAGDRFG